MNFLYNRIGKFLLSVSLVIALNTSVKAQTTLLTGDLAFSGYLSNDAVADQFSFVLLKNITSTTVIRFCDFGWRPDLVQFNSGVGILESELVFTAGSAMNAGTEITIVGSTATIAGGGSAGTVVYTAGASFTSPLNLASTGDQLFAYQGSFAAPTFIAGMHMNVYTGAPSTTTAAAWDGILAAVDFNNNNSGKPAALTTGTNALWFSTEFDNARYNCALGNITTVPLALASLNNPANWISNNTNPSGFVLPTGCNYVGIFSAPVFTLHPPVTTTICEGTGTSFTVAATGATSYQWQVDNGGGFVNVVNDATYSGATTATLTITNAPVSLNGYIYRSVATNGAGSTNSNNGTLTVTPLPLNPTLLAKVPAAVSVADGTPVSATFNAGSGGTTCTDDYRYTTNGGGSYTAYTPGTPISTTGLAALTGYVFIEGRRAGCASLCQNSYVVLAAWYVTPLPAAATTLNAGDIAFSGYTSTVTDAFSFVLLKNIGPGTVINFTDNGWLSTNVFGVGEQTATWTSNAAYPAGTEIIISGLTAILAAGGSAGTVTGAALSLATTGDQVLAYRGPVGAPIFISAIHMNVEAGSTAAAWDGAVVSTNASALPLGLTTGTNCIWIGTAGDLASEFENARYGNCAGPGTLGPINTLRAALNNQANWIRDNLTPPGFLIPTGCLYFGLGTPPNFTLHPVASSVCEGVNTSFTVTAAGAISYQWQVDNGGGFVNLSNNATYSGVTTTTLNINATPFSLNGYLYRAVATNVSGSTNSNSALLTVTALPVRPTLLAKTPASATVADGTPVSATFNAGSGGTGCSDDFRYTVDGGTVYLPYTPGTPIPTTGLSGASGFVFIEGRRAGCSSGCQGSYEVLAAWRVTPIPVAASTLNAGDIAFSGYTSTSAGDDFSFVLLRNIGPGTTINFTDNGWLSANVFGVGEQTVTWTAPAGGLPGGTEITISGLTATRSGPGAAGTVTGTPLSLASTGDQILAYRGPAGGPTFISAIHMNVYTIANGEPVNTTAAAWDGVAPPSNNASALPTGLTTGVNCIWIGTTLVPSSEFDNSRYGNCSGPGILGPLTGLRAALNNQANWISDNNTPPSFTLPTGCNYLSVLCPTITVTNPANTNGTLNVVFSETFTSTGGTPTVTYTTSSTLPTGLSLSSAGVLSGTPTQGGTFPIVVTATDAAGCTGNGPTYNLVIACPAAVLGTATPASQTICSGATITTIVLAGVPGAVYNWTRDNNVAVTGIAASGAGDISGALTNTTAAPVTVTFTITPVTFGSCNQTAYTATVLVNPTPDAVATPSSQTICSGATITTIALTGSVSGTVFNWTRDNNVAVTGIAASGSGDISGSLTNTTTAPVTVTFTITPTANGCPGTPITATVVVNPIPDATATPSSQSRCSGQNITPIIMSGAVSGTSFNWVRDNFPTIGGTIPASGSGNISGNLINNTGVPVTVTFTITPTANSCPGTPITATVTVNPLPTASITGGNAYVCQESNPVLTAGFDPGYTYQWGRSLFVAPWTNLGTAQTQAITASGNYLLTVTNQYGCVDTAMTVMNVADYRFNGTLAAGDALQTGRINRFAVISTCAAPKACPGIFTAVGSRLYDSYTITNPSSAPVCATIGINSFCATNIFCVAYLNSFNPASLCTNYLADGGSSFTFSGFYEAIIPANGTMVVVVHEVNTSTGCTGYTLTVDVPREAAGITVTPPSPVCSGVPVTLTASAANSYSWTPGGATTQAIVVNPPSGANNYSVLLGYGNFGCNNTAATVVNVGTTPDVNAVANQYFCSGTTTPVISLTSSVPGTTFNWTNNNTAIGLGASGSGNIPSFLTTNATAAPISGTITVTPVNGSCTGTPITFTITVASTPSITSVTHDDICEPGGVVNLAAAGNGTINWWNALTGGVVVNTGTTFNPNVTTTTTYYVDATTTSGPQTLLAMPAQSNTFPGNVRGYWFTAPTDFVITSLSVPTTASSGPMSIAVVKFTGNVPPPVFSATTNAFTTMFQTFNNPSLGSVPCNIPVAAGEVIGFLGYRGNINSYAPGDYNTTIAGFAVQLQRLGTQAPLTANPPQNIWREFGPTTSISRIEFEYSAGQNCVSAPRVPVTATVFTLPAPTATPSSQTICTGSAITTIVLASQVPGTTFAWVRDNTVTVTGIANSGTGNISGSLTNTTNAPITVTFTITATSPDGCVAPSITATVVVNPIPNAVATPSSQTICSGSAITTIVLTGNVAGTVYNWTRDNNVPVTGIAASGAGNIAGSLTNTTTAPVTVTFTITPAYTNGGVTCTGTPITATVVVNPIPNAVATPSSQTICSGFAITTIALTGNVAGTVYNWVRDNTVTVTGITNSGAGNISGTLTNTTSAPITVTFTITPAYTNAGVTCTGTPITATVLVNPTPNAVATPASQTVCSGTPITTIVLTGAVAGTTFNWTRDNTVPVTGIAASGAGNISGTLTNTTTSNVTVTFTITPVANGCTGTPITATVLVKPTPDVIATPTSQTICSGAIAAISFTGNLGPVADYNWVRDNNATVTGLPASGMGNINAALTNTTNAPVTVTFTITPTFNGCTGAPITATVLVNPTANVVATPASQTVCSGNPITTIVLTSAVAGTTYTWTRDNVGTVTGIANSGSGDISGTLTNTSNVPVTVTFTITPAANGCTGTPGTATVLVNPTPNAVATPPSQTICSANPITTIVLTGAVAGTTYNWTRDNTVPVTGIAASGSGNISGTLTNTTSAPVTVTFTITPTANGCAGIPVTATVLVNPTPNAVATPASQTVCSGNPITTIVLTGAVAGTTYNWTRDNNVTVTGIGASGAGNISGILTNTTSAPITVTFTITPTANGCPGAAITATVLVNPTPNAVATPASQTICSASPITTIVLTGAVAGTTYNWTRDNTVAVTGIAASGSGNISGTLTNTTFAPVTVTFTITPTANGCPGAPITATVLVNPTPNAVATPASQTICSGNTITTIILSGAVSGTTYSWTRNNTVPVTGIPASGSGNISGTLTNTTNAPVTVTFTIIPTANGCPGPSITATVLVNPLPNAVATPASQTICSGATITTIVLTSAVAGTTYNWTRDNTINVTGSIGGSGTGNISGSLINNTFVPVLVTFTITPTANGCPGTPTTATVLVNPTPDAFAAPSSQTVCSDNQITPIILSGNVAGTTFNWTRNNTATVLGIPASGSGNISGVLINTTNAPVLVTFTITPTANGCTGAPITATVLTYPTPSAVATPASQTICSGATITTIVLTGPVAGTTFNWTRNNTGTVTGIAASGTGNISGALTNTTIAAITVTFTITSTANGCAGTPITATVTVNPTPTVTCPANVVVNAAAGTCSAVVTYPPATATGTPPPSIFYSIPSGSTFPVGVTPVTVTAANICGTVTCTFTVTVVDVRLPVINTQPVNTAVCVGNSATFSVVATNVVSYQWQVLQGTFWNNLNGATGTSLTLTNTNMFMNNGQYRVAVTGPCGTVVFSNAVTLIVNPPPVITLSSLSTPVLLPNRTVTITATTYPPGGNFVWLLNGNIIPGVTGPSIGPLTVVNVGTYTATYTDPNGCVNGSLPFVVSAGITDFLWVYPNPNTGQFNVRFYNQTGEAATVKVFNGLGQEVYAQSVVLGVAYTNIQINMSNQAAGWYIVRVMNGSGAEMGSKRIFIYHP